MTARHPVAYVRRSFSRRGDPGDISREFQTEAVRRMAGDDGDALVIVDRDWGISASREATEQRLGFLALIESIERGEVSTLYAFSADRLARSAQWSARLLDACEDAGTAIVTTERAYAPDNDDDRSMFLFQAQLNEGALRQMKRKARASIDVRKARGDDLGPAPYGFRVVNGKREPNPDENVQTIVTAYHAAGTVQGAAKALNDAEVPTRSGKPWRATTVRGILDRADVLPRRPVRGRPPTRTYLLSKLLRCPVDGSILSGRVNTKGRRGFAYECKRAQDNANHGPYSVSEARLLPAVRAEADRLLPPDAVALGGDEIEAKRAAIDARRERIVQNFEDGDISRDEKREKLAALDRELDNLDIIESIEEVPTINWERATTDELNAVLRTIWDRVELGPDLMPARFVWRVPEWRRPQDVVSR